MNDYYAQIIREAQDAEYQKDLEVRERIRQERLNAEPELTLAEQMAQEIYAEFDAEDERNRENWKIV